MQFLKTGKWIFISFYPVSDYCLK